MTGDKKPMSMVWLQRGFDTPATIAEIHLGDQELSFIYLPHQGGISCIILWSPLNAVRNVLVVFLHQRERAARIPLGVVLSIDLDAILRRMENEVHLVYQPWIVNKQYPAVLVAAKLGAERVVVLRFILHDVASSLGSREHDQ